MGGRGSSSASSTSASGPAVYQGGIPQTGQTIYFAYSHNTNSAPPPGGMDFGQKIEPAGYYANVSAKSDYMVKNRLPGWEVGYVKVENALVLEHKSTTSNGWKKDLSEMFGGKTGKRLSEAVKKAGYDAIVTYDADYPSDPFNETVLLVRGKSTEDEFARHSSKIK